MLAAVLWLAAFVAPRPAAPEEPGGRYREWLDEVELLLGEEEREAFLSLERDYRRSAFIERFWEVRDPFPDTRRNELREAWEQRLEAARRDYRELTDLRAQAFLAAGEPRSKERAPCPMQLRAAEIWIYGAEAGFRGPFTLVFLPAVGAGGDHRLWSPRQGLAQLLSGTQTGALHDPAVRRLLLEQCPRGADLVEALAWAIELDDLMTRAPALRRPSQEWVAAFLARSTQLPETAQTFAAGLEFRFPGRHQARTVVQGLVSVPLEAAVEQAPAIHRFVLDGEILRAGRLFDQFRYRFELPSAELSDPIPLVFERYLRPGDYTVALKVHDLASDRYHRVERPVEVPAVARQAATRPGAPAPPATPAPQSASPAARLAEANASVERGDYRLTLRVPPGRLLTGRVRVAATSAGDEIDRVAFLLDGRRVMTKSRPPYSVELNLGHAPRLHRLEAVGYDASGEEVARAEVPINAGPNRFSVHLLEPRPGRPYRSSLRARAEVSLPRGARLERVEFYLNEALLATLYQGPFVQPILLPGSEQVTYVRAVAYLDDGNSTEDLVFINAPEQLEQVEVTFVELYTSVLDRAGRPVEGLSLDEFEVLEDGVPQRVMRFDRVENLPIYAGVVIDASTSMVEEIHEAERAAQKFFQRVIQEEDRAAVVVFNDQPHLRVPLTNSPEVLGGGLVDLEVAGETALYDSIVFAVHYFSGIRAKRALVLLTDGQDSVSRYSFDEALDFAKRSGIAVYSIGLDLSLREFDIRTTLQRLARETGGDCFFIERAGQLDAIYERIEEELRTQYLLGYQSSQAGSREFREVEVRLARPDLTAKTIPGYYP